MASNPAKEPITPRPIARRRLTLGSSRRRLGYERRIRIWIAALTLPSVASCGLLLFWSTGSPLLALASTAGVAFAFLIAATYFFDQLIRPMQTLANVVAALREDDFSFRARGARRGDALGDLALEINALAGTLQTQRASARDALTLAERVMTSMQSPVLAFDAAGALRLLNPAAESAFRLTRRLALGRTIADLGLEDLLEIPDEDLYSAPSGPFGQPTRYSVRRATFRLHGLPHTLLVLADVAAALREEERIAWQRLIRVLSHEINNSLTPIKSLAGSLRTRIDNPNPAELHRGLTVIEERAASLNRFLQAYQRLTRLPAPTLATVPVGPLLEQVAHLETRLRVEVEPGPPLSILGDPDQLQHLIINLVRNAVEAAQTAAHPPHVTASWSATGPHIVIRIRDNGPGLLNPANLFVPFYTTKPEGSGIGLVLAQQIASAHRGSVTLANNPDGTGCTAELRLPAAL
jgi:nitrogen fixation/metabolism regulation signal transduction histidine kinase